MSVDRNYYVIAGFDLTNYKTDEYDDWRWTDEAEKYTCNQRKGEIQLFDDPMGGYHLYFGYVLAAGDEYDFKTTKFSISLPQSVALTVGDELLALQHAGAIKNTAFSECLYEIILFEECT